VRILPMPSRYLDCAGRIEVHFLVALVTLTAIFSFSKPASAQTLVRGSPAAGAAIFRKVCGACHTSVPERNSIGPSLYGVFGRKAGQAPDYRYSTALSRSGITWTEENLLTWLTSPSAKVPGTKMTFEGVANADQRNDLVAFLKSLGASQN
jgi:cytochrome c